MSISFENKIRVSIFGASHASEVGVTVEGLPEDFAPDMEALSAFLARRAPGRADYSSARKEADVPEVRSGLKNGKTTAAPLTVIIKNSDIRPQDYAALQDTPRPGHADYTARVKYGAEGFTTGGGQFSGRMTAPLCIAGGLCLQLLAKEGITVKSHIAELAGIQDVGSFPADTAEKSFPVLSDTAGEKMQEAILAAKREGDSVGGIIECAVCGLPAGLGGPLFEGMEGRIAQIVFAIPAVKGIEFGAGFASARMRGSENNDAFCYADGQVLTATNHCGGILGGITTGMPLIFRAAVKPTPSIAKVQQTVNLITGENVPLSVPGRHDACIVPRAVPCLEAAAAIAVYDALLEMRQEK